MFLQQIKIRPAFNLDEEQKVNVDEMSSLD